jgi:nicotinamidase-related amidase
MSNKNNPGLSNTALLLIDMQEHFREMAVKIVPELNATISTFRAAQLPVIFTQHGHRKVELDSGQLG